MSHPGSADLDEMRRLTAEVDRIYAEVGRDPRKLVERGIAFEAETADRSRQIDSFRQPPDLSMAIMKSIARHVVGDAWDWDIIGVVGGPPYLALGRRRA